MAAGHFLSPFWGVGGLNCHEEFVTHPHHRHPAARTIALLVWALVAPGCGSNSESTGTSPGSTGSGGAASGGQSGTSTSTSPSGGAEPGSNVTGGSSSAGGAAAFNPCPATGTCAIMPLGDSITDGVGSSAGGGYRVQLFHDAVQGHQSITFVGSATDPNGPATVDGKTFPRNHEGHPGYTIDNSSTTSGISPLVDASSATNHPNIILLMIGTNDINRNIDPANAPTRLGTLLDKIIADTPNSLVVVAKITPWQDDGTNTSAVAPYNSAIATVVQTRITSGKHVTLVDMYTPFRANSNYKTALMNDYLHPNDAGYVIMGDTWYAAIKSYLPGAP
jgi:lysophospholipase L1-like esterase